MKRISKKRLSAKTAIAGAVLLAFAAPVAANVAVTNFMDAGFSTGGPPCLEKVAGEDVTSFPDGFAFDGTSTATVDGLQLTQEHVTINGVTGDRVLADEVWRIENNCTSTLEVSIVNGQATGDWSNKHLEVWLGNVTNTGTFPTVAPAAGSAEWDQAPIIMAPGGVSNPTTGTVTLLAGESVPVGMVVSTGHNATTSSGAATWQVQAVTP